MPNHQDLFRVMSNAFGTLTLDLIKQEVALKGSNLNLIKRALGHYHNAKDIVGPRYGLSGVGCITFANNRLATYCNRVGLDLS